MVEKYEPHRESFRKVVDTGKAKVKSTYEKQQEILKKSIDKAHGILDRGPAFKKA